MAATLIDSLIVELGLDPTKFTKGQKATLDSFKKTQEEARKTARDVEASAAKLRDLITTVRNQVLGLFALFTGGRSIKDFVHDTFNLDNWISRLSKTMGVSAATLNAWQNMAKQVGGSAEGITGSMQNLTSQIQEFAVTGNSTMIPYLRSLGVQLVDANGKIKTADALLLDLAKAVEGMDKRRATFILGQMGLDEGTIILLMEGRKALEAQLEEQKKLGLVTEADEAAGRKFVKTWSQVEQTATSVGRTFLTLLEPALDTVLSVLKDFLEELVKFPILGDIVTASLLTLSSAFTGRLLLSILGVTGGFSGLFLRLALLTDTLLPALSGAFLAVGAVIEVTPIGWILTGLAAIAAAAYLIYNNWSTIKDWWHRLWGGVGDDVEEADQKIAGRFNVDPRKKGGAPKLTTRTTGGVLSWGKPDLKKADDSDVGKLMRMGWSREQAIGIAANIQRESSGRIGRVGDSGEAYGLAQWHKDRQADFAKWAGHDIHTSTRDEQLAFINYELREGKERPAGRRLSGALDAASAAAIVSKYYERPGKVVDEANLRAAMAAAMAGRGGAVSAPGNVTSSSETNINGDINVYTSATDAEGIARDIKPALNRNNFAAQANYGPN